MIGWIIESWWGLWKVSLARCPLAKCLEWYLVVLGLFCLSLLPCHHEERSCLCHMSALSSCTASLHAGTLHTCSYRPLLTEPLRTWANTIIALSFQSVVPLRDSEPRLQRVPQGFQDLQRCCPCKNAFIRQGQSILTEIRKEEGRERPWGDFQAVWVFIPFYKPRRGGSSGRENGQHRGGRQSPSPLQPKPQGRVGLSQPGHVPHMLPILKLERDGSAFRPHPGESALTGSEMYFTSSCHKWQPLDPSLPFSPHFRGCKHHVEPWYILKGFTRKEGHMESMLSNIQPQERDADFRQFGDPRKYNSPYSTSLRFWVFIISV